MTVIRSSSLPQYADCPRRWAARTLWREVRDAGFNLVRSLPRSIGASVGTGVHGGAAYTMEEKLRTGDLGNRTEAEQRALQELDTAAADGVMWDRDTENKNEAQQQIIRMLGEFRTELAPSLVPMAVERRLSADLGDGFTLSGQSDLELLSPDGIDDFKTGRRMVTHYAQVGSYSLLSRTAHPGKALRRLRVLFIPRVTMKRAQPRPIIEQYNQAVAEQAATSTIDRIKQDVEQFRMRAILDDAPPQHAFLANPGSNLCSPRWCPAFGTNFCKEHRKTPSIEGTDE